MEPICIVAMPDYVENVAIVDDSSVVGIIRATAYPFWRNLENPDTLDIDVILEWNLQAKPIEHVSRVDTFRTADSVWIPVPRPWIEQPAVVAGGTIIGMAIIYGIIESIKETFK
jgi:hypothetical protein